MGIWWSFSWWRDEDRQPAQPGQPGQHGQPYDTYDNGSDSRNCSPDYVKSVPGIFKIVELVLSLLTFAISLGGAWSWWGGGWVEWVAICAFINTLIWLILHIIATSSRRIRPHRLVEFILYVIMAACFLISFLVAAVCAAQLNRGAVGATAFFCIVCTIVYGVDSYFKFRDWQSPPQLSAPAGGAGGTQSPAPVVATVAALSPAYAGQTQGNDNKSYTVQTTNSYSHQVQSWEETETVTVTPNARVGVTVDGRY